jgi:hypothetical protein
MAFFDLHRPADPKSKAHLCFDALAACYETNDVCDLHELGNGKVQVFWGLANNNVQKIKRCQQQNKHWLFVDMPYWDRWTRNNIEWSLAHAKWRWIPGGLHPGLTKCWSIITEKLNIEIATNHAPKGNKLLVCPSSSTVTNFLIGKSDEQWLTETLSKLEIAYPDLNVKVRRKPRAQGTSGPDVAKLSIEEDLADAAATVTLCSICAVDGARLGIPAIATHRQYSPMCDVALDLGEQIKPLTDVVSKLKILSSYQYTTNEVKRGSLNRILKCYSLL